MYVKIERSYHVPLSLLPKSTSFALVPINVITKNKISTVKVFKEKKYKSQKKHSASLSSM